MPVEVDKIAVIQPNAFALERQRRLFAPQGSPQRLQVRVAQPEGRAKTRMRCAQRECPGKRRSAALPQ